ncbi:MAG: PriCT-2 domain-containing protein, partial [Pseudomonadota bacterium]
MTTIQNAFDLIEQNYPAALLEADRWLLWQYLPDINPTKKPRKAPYYANGQPRTTTESPEDIARLVDFATVKAAFEEKPGRYAGPGIALGLDTFDHIQGIDLDGIEEKGLHSLASTLPGLVEVSPSGKGVHALGIGADFQTLASGNNSSGIEAYSHGRFFTCTGQVLRGQLEDLAPFVTSTLAPLHEAGKPARTAGTGAVDGFADTPTEAQVRDLRSALASMRSDDRDLWVRIGLSLKTAGEMGRGLWIEWSQTSSLYDPADA